MTFFVDKKSLEIFRTQQGTFLINSIYLVYWCRFPWYRTISNVLLTKNLLSSLWRLVLRYIYEEKKFGRGQKVLIKNNVKFAGKFIYEIEMNEKCFVHGHIWSDEFVDQKNGKIARNSKILSSLSWWVNLISSFIFLFSD